MPETRGWLPGAALAVGLITAARLSALWFDRTDLYVDEAQYWLWGRNLDFGYYSKPPLIAWVIRLVTTLAGSDAAFWVRLPGALLHGATALILGTLGARLDGARTGFWVAIGYATLPFVALGSLLISTDTVMAPAFAAALLFHHRAVETGQGRHAALAGVMAGLAIMAKYAGAYFLLGAGLAALFVPQMRLGRRNGALLILGVALVVLPNLIWNAAHGFATFAHTADNAGWLRSGVRLAALNPGELARFFLAQFAVFGPVLFAALLWGYLRPGAGKARALVWFSAPVLGLVCVQALLTHAYANWAVAAYFPGVLIAVPLLLARAPRLFGVSLALNGAICLSLPLLTITAPAPERNGKPLLSRYIGQGALSRQILDLAAVSGARGIAASDRAVLADLFYTGRDAGIAVYAVAPRGRAMNYYEETFPLPDDAGEVLLVTARAPACAGAARDLDTADGAYAGRALAAYLVRADCANAAR
ncbi:MAG: glycosyltransferase family 39 protein [Defluviimonas sp.]|uniref:ArnT family glycosyltransferase n=1 Tax=Albidovulum sp. TaxID=1872424 RepID=UPI002A2D056A|nr:glycosyltransferase family 39 protein [Defluviimonas sp.]